MSAEGSNSLPETSDPVPGEPVSSPLDGSAADASGDSNAKKRHTYRGRHRAASHASAHSDEQASVHESNFKHPLLPTILEPLVADQASFDRFLADLRAAGSFAYDSEFIGEDSYHPRLCLIQAATTKRLWLIDPIAPIDLTSFWELLADPSVEKIVHAGEQDLEPVVRHLNRPARNVFDTQIAAGFAAMAYPTSLAKLVLELTGVKLGKGLTFTDWSQRPLSNVQLRYAADDVRYLPAMADMLRKKMAAPKYENWARMESEAMGDPSRFIFDPESDFLRVRGAGGLPPQNLAVLKELTHWRDQAAQKADQPPRH